MPHIACDPTLVSNVDKCQCFVPAAEKMKEDTMKGSHTS